jgi:flagellar protein FlaG
MDVQAAAATANLSQPVVAPSTPAPASGAPTLAAAPVAATSLVSAGAVGSNAATAPVTTTAIGASGTSNPNPGLATLPAGPPDGSKKGSDVDSTLKSGVAQLYNVAQQNISVSFQISQNPNEIVTVFTDTQTGKVIVQFPSETMIALAKLFDKLDGSVVNKKV